MDIVKALLFEDGGVILSGPPGTSKSYYADLVAHDVAGDETRVKSIQFHPSYQYEDFMEGYLPDPKTGSFSLKPRHFLEIVNDACLTPDENFVLVIDEISRADPARVFGEALTYVEKSKRGKDFYLASGTQAHIPENLYIIATMNPFDRGVEDVDAAFERRFPRVRMDPDEHILRKFLRMNEVDEGLADRVVTFFKRLQSEAVANPAASLGHAFFLEVTDGASLQRLWDHRLSFFIDRGFPLDVETRQSLTQMWQNYVLGGGASSGPDETVSGE
jgi:5-methylcytosine-specific restriction protein B